MSLGTDRADRADPAAPPAPGPLDSLLVQLGMPAPGAVVAELQLLNRNLEAMRPDIHALALATESGELPGLTKALRDGTELAARIYGRIWPGETATGKQGGVAS